MTIDIGRAFSFVFEDENWIKKVLIGGLMFLVPIFGWFCIGGYMVETARNVRAGRERPLPEWNNWGDKFMLGLYLFLIGLAYSLMLMIPIMILIAVPGIVVAMFDEEAGAMLMSCLSPVGSLLSLVVYFVMLPVFVRFIHSNDLGDAFKFGEVIAMIRKTPGAWFILLLVYILSGIVGSVGMIACGIGALFTTMYGQMVLGHALGQAAAGTYGGGGAAGGGAAGGAVPPAYIPS